MQELYAFYAQQKSATAAWDYAKASAALIGALEEDSKQIQHCHLQLLRMIVFWADLEKQQKKKEKPAECSYFNNNAFLQQLQAMPTFQSLAENMGLCWTQAQLKAWYAAIAPKLAALQNDKDRPAFSYEAAVTWLLGVFQKIIFKQKDLLAPLACRFINWSLYKKSIQTSFLSFIKQIAQKHHDAFVQYVPETFQKEQVFYKKLVTTVINKDAFFQQCIASQLEHWEQSRILQLDNVLLKMSLAETFHFPAIPISATISEYLEIAKVYSSSKSHVFIHGILDALVKKHKITKP